MEFTEVIKSQLSHAREAKGEKLLKTKMGTLESSPVKPKYEMLKSPERGIPNIQRESTGGPLILNTNKGEKEN